MKPHMMCPAITPSVSARLCSLLAALLLAACAEPAPPVAVAPDSDKAAAIDAAQIFAVVYRCKDGTVFTTYPRGESAQNTPAAAPAQSPAAVADCEGSEARTPAEAEQLRAAAVATPPPG